MNGLLNENIIKMKTNVAIKILALATIFCFSNLEVDAQCESWVGSPQEGEASDAHVVYRGHYKSKEYDLAYESWKTAYEIAPAADGKRASHYIDGIEIHKDKLKRETDEAVKKEYKETITRLYDEAIACYESKSITLSKCDTDECYNDKVAFLMGRKGVDMFYSLSAPYSKNIEVLNQSVAKAGVNSEYVVFDPMARIAVYQFGKNLMTKEDARSIYDTLEKIADHNIANHETLADFYQQGWASAQGQFATIEREIFDCEFFKNKLRPDYEDDPNNPDVIKSVLGTLKGQGCVAGDPFIDELEMKWKKYASAENAKIQAEFEANNPAVAANKLYKSGDYAGALAKYKEAISIETDNSKKASYLFSSASIEGRKLKNYNSARKLAKEAAALKSGWGRPYMLIGDLYATSARNCGDSWNQRLAILAAIDKYNYAKSIDSEVANEAREKVSKYAGSMPSQEEGFMRKMKAGSNAKAGCWIGESVKVRFK